MSRRRMRRLTPPKNLGFFGGVPSELDFPADKQPDCFRQQAVRSMSRRRMRRLTPPKNLGFFGGVPSELVFPADKQPDCFRQQAVAGLPNSVQSHARQGA
jgi:hypothetical protein